MSVPIQIINDSAVLDANPKAVFEAVLDKWNSSGYWASLGALNGQYVIKKVIYDLGKVSVEKVREVAKSIDEGLFECPVCTRLATHSADEDNNGDGEPLKEAGKEEEPVLKEKRPKPKEEVKVPEPTLEHEFELDDVEIQELEREKAIQKIVSAMDEILLMKMMR